MPPGSRLREPFRPSYESPETLGIAASAQLQDPQIKRSGTCVPRTFTIPVSIIGPIEAALTGGGRIGSRRPCPSSAGRRGESSRAPNLVGALFDNLCQCHVLLLVVIVFLCVEVAGLVTTTITVNYDDRRLRGLWPRVFHTVSELKSQSELIHRQRGRQRDHRSLRQPSCIAPISFS